MVAEKTSVDEIIAVLKVKSFEEQMRVIAALSQKWVEAEVTVTPSKTVAKPVAKRNDFDVRTAGAGSSAVEEVDSRVKNKTTNVSKAKSKLSLDDLFGAWKDIDKGWDMPIEEVIKESQTSKIDSPNFDS